MNKTVIAIWGEASQGKSSSVIEIVNQIQTYFPTSTINYLIKGVDVKVIIQIGSVLIGLESQGDPPGTRLKTSLNDFVNKGCQIIICTCRTRGLTVNAINNMNTIHKYDIIWTSNFFSKEKNEVYTNGLYAKTILVIINDIINGVI